MLKARVLIFAQYRRMHPAFFTMPGGTQRFYVDPREPRGMALLQSRGVGQGVGKTIWRAALDQLRPNIVIDVGANYGEFLFCCQPSPHARCIAIEANPDLYGYLQKSLADCTWRDQVQLICGLAAERTGADTPFYVDKSWSGRSSAIPGRIAVDGMIMARSVALDDLIEDSSTTSLVFKIDVEGYEFSVLRGMAKALANSSGFFGIVEFNPDFIRRAGEIPARFCDLFPTDTSFASLGHRGSINSLSVSTLDSARSCDIIVARGPEATALLAGIARQGIDGV